ncbi:hypothetical protein ASPCAL03258 [Aspergillus calidoustus]|uniref:NmrA-like domain-containing protein n=1 Tax=Aspergillus calidoustus TaxID=454130 RepID=A0A0U5GMQ0_ASPCI|nr:hypothetical protein ASPCAL03258 [Aspergillus calidoustus]
MIHVKAYLDAKESVAGVHILIGGFMEPIFSPFFDIVDVQSNTFRYCGDGNEMMEGTTYDDAAKYTAKVVLDSTANGVLKCKSLDFRYLSSIVTTLLHLSLGGRATIQEIARKLPGNCQEIAKTYEAVYGVPVKLEQRGYLDDLYRTMRDLRDRNPQDIYSYMSF